MIRSFIICDSCGESKFNFQWVSPLPEGWTHDRSALKDLCPTCSKVLNNTWEDVLKGAKDK